MMVLHIAKKEFRAWFASPLAVMFLAVFELSVLFTFFGYERFFARNIADVRPMFAWLPLLLVFLASALSMRQWAEEQKTGTIEVLLTLPLGSWQLVAGKFLAGMGLVAVALALTAPIPALVSTLGPLDFGPVIGGYAAALLLASTYLAIGLCVSALTDNQVVSLLMTLLLGGLLYVVGSDRVTALTGTEVGSVLRALGSGSRFESVERGVLDLRDVLYYASFTGVGLALNVVFLETRRMDGGSPVGRRRTLQAWTLLLLGLANAAAANLWMAPVSAARLDLTARHEYSLSDVTDRTIAELREPLRITGYFSSRTHPMLAPLIPEVKDLLEEYRVHGHGRVEVRFADPSADDALADSIAESWGIKSIPFRVADRHEKSVVNGWFHLLVQYGDQFQVLSADDLVESTGEGDDAEARLRSFEHDLTQAIRRVSQDFTSFDALVPRLPAGASLTAYISPSSVPRDASLLPGRLGTLARDVASRSQGRIAFREVDPSQDATVKQRLLDDYGIQPLVAAPNPDPFWLYLVFQAGDRFEVLQPRPTAPDADIRRSLEEAIRRAVPGQLRHVGLLTGTRDGPAGPDYQRLRGILSQDFAVEDVDPTDRRVPDVDAVVVAKPGRLDDRSRFILDQILMRGKSVVAFAGSWQLDPSQKGLAVARSDPSLGEWLHEHGVDVGGGLVLDPQNTPFPVPAPSADGAPRFDYIPYPFFSDIHDFEDHPSLSGVDHVTAPWASPLAIEPVAGVDARVLLATSAKSWTSDTGQVQPDFQRFPDGGFPGGGDIGPKPVAVALTGEFPSSFAGKPNPLGDAPVLQRSLPDARLVVLGTSEIGSDLMFRIAESDGDAHRMNVQFLHNLVDWSVADTELLSIRNPGAFARTLRPMDASRRDIDEWGSVLAVIVLLSLVTLGPRLGRAKPIPLGVP
jgi:ABC-2 type transport system permease protein